jgi:Ax21 family sulfation-dependent quorum factor
MKRSPAIAKLAALALVAAAPFAASAADGINYNYVQGGYTATNTASGDADGWGLQGSAALSPNFHLFGDFSQQDIKHTSANFDQWRVGVGYNRQVAQNTDLVTRVAYEKFDAGSGLTTDGYSVEAGARASLTPMLEGYAMAGYEDGKDYEGDFYGRLGAQVKFNQNWGLAADVKLVKGGDNQFFVGPRLTW